MTQREAFEISSFCEMLFMKKGNPTNGKPQLLKSSFVKLITLSQTEINQNRMCGKGVGTDEINEKQITFVIWLFLAVSQNPGIRF